jgi:hypothetical protein
MMLRKWMQGGRLHRFIVYVPVFSIPYLIVCLVGHWAFRWEFRWVEFIFWGLSMAAIYTFQTPGSVSQ